MTNPNGSGSQGKGKGKDSRPGTPQSRSTPRNPTSEDIGPALENGGSDSKIESSESEMEKSDDEKSAAEPSVVLSEPKSKKDRARSGTSKEIVDKRRSKLAEEKRAKDERRKKDPNLYALDFTNAIKELNGWDLGIVNQDDDMMARAISRKIHAGSQLHTPTS